MTTMNTTFEKTNNLYTEIVITGYKDQIILQGQYPQLAFQKLFDFLSLMTKQDKAKITIHVKRGTIGNYTNNL
jgi:hypothetical protein